MLYQISLKLTVSFNFSERGCEESSYKYKPLYYLLLVHYHGGDDKYKCKSTFSNPIYRLL